MSLEPTTTLEYVQQPKTVRGSITSALIAAALALHLALQFGVWILQTYRLPHAWEMAARFAWPLVFLGMGTIYLYLLSRWLFTKAWSPGRKNITLLVVWLIIATGSQALTIWASSVIFFR